MKNENVKQAITPVVEHRSDVEIITGANVYLSLEDARGILLATEIRGNDGEISSNEHDEIMHKALHISRDMIRRIAKAVLWNNGTATPQEQLWRKFGSSEQSDY